MSRQESFLLQIDSTVVSQTVVGVRSPDKHIRPCVIQPARRISGGDAVGDLAHFLSRSGVFAY